MCVVVSHLRDDVNLRLREFPTLEVLLVDGTPCETAVPSHAEANACRYQLRVCCCVTRLKIFSVKRKWSYGKYMRLSNLNVGVESINTTHTRNKMLVRLFHHTTESFGNNSGSERNRKIFPPPSNPVPS